jgi:hypothetical protein
MITVYIAGPYSDPSVIRVQENMREGLNAAVDLIQRGYAPFCPWLDFTLGLIAPITIEQYYAYSMAWLERSDAVLMLSGWEDSKGAMAEANRAVELDIPVYEDLSRLMDEMPA